MTYTVYLAPGCHNEPFDPEVSEHDTFEEALEEVMQNDRLYTEDDNGKCYQIPAQGSEHGPGRYGYGLSDDEARAYIEELNQ